MNRQDVIALMKSSKSEAEWNANCDKVKAACDGYPAFWCEAIVLSGLAARVSATWGGDDKIRKSSCPRSLLPPQVSPAASRRRSSQNQTTQSAIVLFRSFFPRSGLNLLTLLHDCRTVSLGAET